MRPKLSQPNGASASGPAPAISQPLTSVPSTSTAALPSTSTGVINPVFVSDLVDSTEPTGPPPTKPKPSKQPLHKPRSSSGSSGASSGGSTVETTASDNRRTLTTSSVEIGDQHSSNSHHSGSHSTAVKQRVSPSQHSDPSCDYCYRFHVNNHHTRPQRSHRVPPTTRYLYEPPVQPYAPYPPQWYYLLGADSKQFRKHKHSHYRKDCKVCRQIVRQTFEQYYLGASSASPFMGPRDRVDGSGSNTPETSSIVPVSLMSDHHSDPLLESAAVSSATASPLPFVFLPRRRANCGHSCLKYSILFYCSVAVILAICFICYLTKMFGYLEVMPSLQMETAMGVTSMPDEMLPTGDDSMINDTMARNGFAFPTTTTPRSPAMEPPAITSETASSMFEMVRFEVIGIIVCTALLIIFFLGLIGAFIESVLCLRIFGAILSYLFLLTFGAALYIIILLVISQVPAKLVLSTVSCSAVAITLHAALAISPFAFADLISQERQDEKNELSSTYFKYPSVRFLPNGAPGGGGKRRSSYFSLSFLNNGGRMWTSRARMAPYPLPTHHRAGSSIPPSSARTSPVHQQDNLSSEGLIPSNSAHPSTVRFNDNWI